MNVFIKITILALIAIGLLSICFGAYKMYVGNYFENSPITASIISVFMAAAVYYCIRGAKAVILLAVVGLLAISQGCNYAKSNQQVIISNDCGMTWKKIKSGDAVPKAGLNGCYAKVVIPNYPMQGESRFVANLKDRVRANIHIDYDYSIIDALAFITQAKYIGKSNADADSDNAIGSSFEAAENMVIDKRIKDVSKDVFLSEDIVELDQSELETRLLAASNKILEPLGVRLNFITLTFDLDEQTRQAIDVSTAMKIYESRGLTEIGKQVMSARAGATKIVIEGDKGIEAKKEQD